MRRIGSTFFHEANRFNRGGLVLLGIGEPCNRSGSWVRERCKLPWASRLESILGRGLRGSSCWYRENTSISHRKVRRNHRKYHFDRLGGYLSKSERCDDSQETKIILRELTEEWCTDCLNERTSWLGWVWDLQWIEPSEGTEEGYIYEGFLGNWSLPGGFSSEAHEYPFSCDCDLEARTDGSFCAL